MKLKTYSFRGATLFITCLIGVFCVRLDVDCRSAVTVYEPLTAVEEKSTPPAGNSPVVSADEYAVFSSLLSEQSNGEELIVGDHSLTFERNWLDEQLGRSLNFGKEAVIDFASKNRTEIKLENKFALPDKIYLLSRAEEDFLFPKGGAGWDKFYERFPKAKGIIYLSNVGFNTTKTEALVYVSRQCRACNGNFFRLTKVAGKWSTANRLWSSSAVE